MLVFELTSSTLKMEAICSSETSVETQRTTRRHIPEDDTLHIPDGYQYHTMTKPVVTYSQSVLFLCSETSKRWRFDGKA
jgi:hypothetical protein